MVPRRRKAGKLKQPKSETIQCPKGDQLELAQVNLDKDVSPSASSPPFAIHSERSTAEQHVDLLPFISHCSLFPLGYEFSKQELISLWAAQDLFTASSRQVENQVFASLLSDEVVLPSRVFDGDIDGVPDDVKHLSIDAKSIKHVGFESLERFRNLETLFVTPTPGFYVDQVPRDLFLRLKHLRALNFSGSHILELPSSFGNLKLLRYLDLSYTPIKRLPDSIVSLSNLQTLRLKNCFKLDGLPEKIGKLTSLKHFVFDILGRSGSMPHGIGNLTSLQTLSNFFVGTDDGCRIVELKDLVDLTGSLCILSMENVSSFEEAREVDLSNKKLVGLYLRWSTYRECDAVKEEQILQYLKPSLDLEELEIASYGGFKLPNWFSDPSYVHLVDMKLYNCMNCECLLPIGKLPALRFLLIDGMDKLERIDEHFCRDGEDQQYHAFPKLENLTIQYMRQLKEWTGIQNGDFPWLNKLQITFCPELHSLPVLSSLDSLKRLELSCCPNIKYSREIAHVPNVFIDGKKSLVHLKS
ncbi:putative disease resistance protein At3g14460 isoform X2 [Arachis stenosperma]|uniref:putative disease resistance protein At3g14460 isoform X2 n=1 Tax=Arachis stenosperma TaxID=217475 RepID=UPI0025AC4BA2|nr:putative disease resistance protein At3g14460 isoform X2 [Arachis stenosperma]